MYRFARRLALLLILNCVLCASLRAAAFVRRFAPEDRVVVTSVAEDSAGNVLLAGTTERAAELPKVMGLPAAYATPLGGRDGFLMKLNRSGVVQFTLVFGGPGNDDVVQLAVSPTSLAVVGTTTSDQFLGHSLTLPGRALARTFLVVFDATGTNILARQFWGGSEHDVPTAVVFDALGRVVVAGRTASAVFPRAPIPPPVGSISIRSYVYGYSWQLQGAATYLVDLGPSTAWDSVRSMVADSTGGIFMVGRTASIAFPAIPPPLSALPVFNFSRAFVTGLNAAGDIDFSIQLTGDYSDSADAVALIEGGRKLRVVGRTESASFPSELWPAPTGPVVGPARGWTLEMDIGTRTLSRPTFFGAGAVDEMVGMASWPDGHYLLAGQSARYAWQSSGGFPFLVTGSEAEVGALRPEPLHPNGGASLSGVFAGSDGGVLVCGTERRKVSGGAFVGRYSNAELTRPAVPLVQLVSPGAGQRYAPHADISVQALVVGTTSSVRAVTFLANGRSLGTVPDGVLANGQYLFSTVWSDVRHGAYDVVVVADLGGLAVTSRTARITVSSPRNDSFAQRTRLTGSSFDVGGDTAGAVAEAGGWYGRPAVWYSWTAPADGVFEFSLELLDSSSGLFFGSGGSITTGSSLPELQTTASLADAQPVALRVRAGDEFVISIFDTGVGIDGRFRLKLRQVVPPVNDPFDHPIGLVGDSILQRSDVRHATAETGDSPYAGLGVGTVWYTWTAPTSGPYLLATATGGRVMPFTGTDVTALSPLGTVISGVTNGYWFNAQAGLFYRIMVAGSGLDEVVWTLSPAPPPENDNFANRTEILSTLAIAHGTLIGASIESGEPESQFAQGSVWWSWTPREAGVYAVRVRPVTVSTSTTAVRLIPPRLSSLVSVYSGDALAALQSVSSGITSEGYGNLADAVQVYAGPGTNYAIAVRAPYSQFFVELSRFDGPTNDSFEQAAQLDGFSGSVSGSLRGATLESGESTLENSPDPSAVSVWYRWTAPADREYSISANSDLVGVFRGESLSSLETIHPMGRRFLFTAVQGTEYRIRVAGKSPYLLRIRPAIRPGNDDFERTLNITGFPARIVPEGFDATSEAGEISHSWSSPGGLPPTGPNESVWYAWVAPVTGSCLLSTPYPVAVYSGDTLSNLVAVSGGTTAGGFEFSSKMGVTYHLAVNLGAALDYPTLRGQPLELHFQSSPANDNFAQRIALRGRTVEALGANVGATAEDGEPPLGSDASGRTVWWTWRAPASGRALFKLESAGSMATMMSGGLLGVFSGNSVDHLTVASAADPEAWPSANGDPVNVAVDAGHYYHVAVDTTRTGKSGQFRVRVTFQTAAPNDNFAERIRFPSSGRVTGGFLGATTEAAEPRQSPATPGTLWWSWTPRTTGVYEVAMEHEDGDGNPKPPWVALSFEIFTGDTLENLEFVNGLLMGGLDGQRSRARFFATAGVRYALRLAGTAERFRAEINFLPPPVNDAFANRIVLRGTNISVLASNSTATVEPGEPLSEVPGAQTVWWTWTAPARGAARVHISEFACQEVRVYTGSSFENLSDWAVGESGTALFQTEAKRTYQILAEPRGCGGNSGDLFALSLVFYQPPSNDDFARRTRLSGAPVTVTNATLLGATPEAGEPEHAPGSGSSVWWSWTAPSSGRYTIECKTGETVTSMSLLVLTGDTLGSLSLRAGMFGMLNFEAVGGTEYVLMVDGFLEESANGFQLGIRPTPIPSNDNFVNRLAIESSRVTGTLEGASVEAGELFWPQGQSIWWAFTPTNDGWHEFTLTSRGTSIADWANISIFTGNELTNLAWVFPRGPSRFPGGNANTLYLLEPSVSYAIRVASRAEWFGPVEVTWRFVPKAANDHFTNATEVLGMSAALNGTNTLCTTELFEPPHYWSGVTEGNSIWWRWTAPTSGVFSITRSNSPMWAAVDVYTGSTVSNLTRVPETIYGRDFGEYLFRAEAGVRYAISAVTEPREGVIRLALLPANPPPNDDFAARTSVSGAHVTVAAADYDATAEPGDPVAGFIGQQTTWWSWTAPTAGHVLVNAVDSANVRRGGIFIGTNLAALTPVAGPATGWPLEFTAEAGVAYAIGFTPWSGFAGPFSWTLEQTSSAAVPGLDALRLYSPELGRPWVVETSTNLLDWIPWATNSVGTAEFRIEPQPNGTRFFRGRK